MKFKLSLTCNFVGCDEEIFIECYELPTDEELRAFANEWVGVDYEIDEWAGVDYEIEEMPDDDDVKDYQDW